MKILTIACILVTASCTGRVFPPGPNPLNEPGYRQPTVAELHAKNIRLIRGINR